MPRNASVLSASNRVDNFRHRLASSKTWPASAVSIYAADPFCFGDGEPPGQRGMRDVGHDLNRDVRQPPPRRAGAQSASAMISGVPVRRRSAASSTRNQPWAGRASRGSGSPAGPSARQAGRDLLVVAPGNVRSSASAYASVCSSPDSDDGCQIRRLTARCSCSIQSRNHGGVADHVPALPVEVDGTTRRARETPCRTSGRTSPWACARRAQRATPGLVVPDRPPEVGERHPRRQPGAAHLAAEYRAGSLASAVIGAPLAPRGGRTARARGPGQRPAGPRETGV